MALLGSKGTNTRTVGPSQETTVHVFRIAGAERLGGDRCSYTCLVGVC